LKSWSQSIIRPARKIKEIRLENEVDLEIGEIILGNQMIDEIDPGKLDWLKGIALK
jgi:hypothetical protein